MPLTSCKTCPSRGWLSVLSQRASVQTEPWCQSPQCPKGWWVSTECSVPFPLSLSVAPAVFYRAASFTRTPHREEGNAQGRAVSADQSGEISQKSVCVCVCVCVGGGVMRERQNTQREWLWTVWNGTSWFETLCTGIISSIPFSTPSNWLQ